MLNSFRNKWLQRICCKILILSLLFSHTTFAMEETSTLRDLQEPLIDAPLKRPVLPIDRFDIELVPFGEDAENDPTPLPYMVDLSVSQSTQATLYSHKTAILHLWQTEHLSKPRLIDLDHFLERVLYYPFLKETDVVSPIAPDSAFKERSSRHMWLRGRGILLDNLETLQRVHRINGFRQGFELVLEKGVHLGLFLLTVYQATQAENFQSFISSLWNGDENSVRALVYLTSSENPLQGLYALFALPFIGGIVKSFLYGRKANKEPHTVLTSAIADLKDITTRKKTGPKIWHEWIQWKIPFNPLGGALQEIERVLRWDSRTSQVDRKAAIDELNRLYQTSSGYPKLAALYTASKIADSTWMRYLPILREKYTDEEIAELFLTKAAAYEMLFRSSKGYKEAFQQGGMEAFIETLYARYRRSLLGDAQTRLDKGGAWIFNGVRFIISLLILKTVAQAIIEYSQCPKRPGVSFLGEEPWSSDYTEGCFNEYLSLFNLIPGQPASTLTSIMSKFYLPHFGDTLDLSGKGLNGTQATELLQGFEMFQPHLSLTKINLSGNSLNTPQDYEALFSKLSLPYYSRVQSLDLSNNNLEIVNTAGTAALAQGLPSLSRLTSLRLSGNNMGSSSGSGIAALGQHLPSLTKLITLDLSHNWIGASEIESIEPLAQALRYLTSLEDLDLSSNFVGYDSRIGQEGTIALARSLPSLSRLTSLDLSANNIGRWGINGTVALSHSLPFLSSLQHLDLSLNLMGSTSMQGTVTLGDAIKFLPQLRSLNLEQNYIGMYGTEDAGALGKSLSSLRNLEKLILDNNYIGYKGEEGFLSLAGAIMNISTLNTLYIQQRADLPLSLMNSLRSFWAHRSSSTDLYVLLTPTEIEDYLSHFSINTTTINLSSMLNDPDSILISSLMNNLKNFTALTSLDLSGNGIGFSKETAAVALGNTISTLTNLEHLNLLANRIGVVGTAGTKALALGLRSLTNLRTLILTANFLGYQGESGIIALGNSLPFLVNLSSLDLSNNLIGYHGPNATGALAIGIRSLPVLENLRISEALLGDKDMNGTIALGQAFSFLPRLQSLDFSGNQIGTLGTADTEAIAQGLTSCNLRSLDLSNNHIGLHGEAGLLALGDSISSFSSLTSLNLGGNPIGSTGNQGSRAILNSLPHLPNLYTINLSGLTNTTWTAGAQALASFNSRKLQRACESNLCFGIPLNRTSSTSSPSQAGAMVSFALTAPSLMKRSGEASDAESLPENSHLLSVEAPFSPRLTLSTSTEEVEKAPPLIFQDATSSGSRLEPPLLLLLPGKALKAAFYFFETQSRFLSRSIGHSVEPFQLDWHREGFFRSPTPQTGHLPDLRTALTPEISTLGEDAFPSFQARPDSNSSALQRFAPRADFSGSKPLLSSPSYISPSNVLLAGAITIYAISKAKQCFMSAKAALTSWLEDRDEAQTLIGKVDGKILGDTEVSPTVKVKRLRAFTKHLESLTQILQRSPLGQMLDKWYQGIIENYQEDIADLKVRHAITRQVLRDLGLDIGALTRGIISEKPRVYKRLFKAS